MAVRQIGSKFLVLAMQSKMIVAWMVLSLGLGTLGFRGFGSQTSRGVFRQFSKLGSLWGPFFMRVPYYIWDLKGDPNLENYPYA